MNIIQAHTLEITYTIQEMNTCCSMDTITLHKHLDKHAQPMLCTCMGVYLIQSVWNAAASLVLSCPRRSWKSARLYQSGFKWLSLYNYKNVTGVSDFGNALFKEPVLIMNLYRHVNNAARSLYINGILIKQIWNFAMQWVKDLLIITNTKMICTTQATFYKLTNSKLAASSISVQSTNSLVDTQCLWDETIRKKDNQGWWQYEMACQTPVSSSI